MTERPQAEAIRKIDAPHVRVTEFRFAPGAETGWHRHAVDYVVVPLVDGTVDVELPGGETVRADNKAHQPYTRLAGVEHNVINAGSKPYSFLEIEILTPGATPCNHGA